MGPESEKRVKFNPFQSSWLRHRLLGAFIVTRNISRTLGTLLAVGAILATRLPRELLTGGTSSNCSAPPYQPYAPLAPSRPPQCPASFRLFGGLFGYPTSSWYGHSLGCLAPHSSVLFHPFCVPLAARHPSGHSAFPDYPAPSWLLGALRRPPRHSAIS